MDTFVLQVITSSVINMILISLLLYFSKTWIENKLRSSIKHEYDKKLSEIQYEYAKQLSQIEHDREIIKKGELIAELLSEWISKDIDYKKLNDLSFKTFLWLPADLAAELAKVLVIKEDARHPTDILIMMRKHFLGKDDKLEAGSIIYFNDPSKI